MGFARPAAADCRLPASPTPLEEHYMRSSADKYHLYFAVQRELSGDYVMFMLHLPWIFEAAYLRFASTAVFQTLQLASWLWTAD